MVRQMLEITIVDAFLTRPAVRILPIFSPGGVAVTGRWISNGGENAGKT